MLLSKIHNLSTPSFLDSKIYKNKVSSLTWLLWGLCRSTHCVIKNATIALPPNAVMCARTIARTSMTKLCVKPLSPPFCKQFGLLTITVAIAARFQDDSYHQFFSRNSLLVSTCFRGWKRNLNCLGISLFFRRADRIRVLYLRRILLSKAPETLSENCWIKISTLRKVLWILLEILKAP